MIRPLSELDPAEKGTVVKVRGRGAARRRMLDMGVVVGSEVKVERVAPFGDPIEVTVKGYNLSLRKEEAAEVAVELDEAVEAVVPLTEAATGKPLTIVRIDAGWRLTRRLAGMGLAPGASIRRIEATGDGQGADGRRRRGFGPLGQWLHGRPDRDVFVEVQGSRFPLGAGMCGKIVVVEA